MHSAYIAGPASVSYSMRIACANIGLLHFGQKPTGSSEVICDGQVRGERALERFTGGRVPISTSSKKEDKPRASPEWK